MRSLMELAAACEDGRTSDRDLELEIWRSNGGSCPPGTSPLKWLHCYTSRIDAALELCLPEEMPDVVREATSRIGRAFGLHMNHWPAGVPYPGILARFVAAAALRRIDARRRAESGEGVDLEWIELADVHLSIAGSYYRFGSESVLHGDSELDPRPMGRVWDILVDMLRKDGTISLDPGPATDEMVAAGQAAYDRKNDDRWSQSPTEEPDAGGGPIGYAWRAMAKARRAGIAA